MKKLRIVIIFGLLSSAVLGQIGPSGMSDQCEVSWAERGSKRVQTLGKFKTDVGEEQSTTRIYRIPKTKFFLAANVFYTDESLASPGVNFEDSISLQLIVSKTRKLRPKDNLVNVEAEQPYHGTFTVGRVTLRTTLSRRFYGFVMECNRGR